MLSAIHALHIIQKSSSSNNHRSTTDSLFTPILLYTLLDQLSMATTAVEPLQNHHDSAPTAVVNPKRLRACFSYAAYAKNLIHNIRSFNIPVEAGLSDAEFADVESSLKFTFPPDLRAILQEGLPVGPGFPHWRSFSKRHLEILMNLPMLELWRKVSRNQLWVDSWGDDRSDDFLKKAPILVPIYRRFYIPATPCIAGNPVFYVHGGDVRLWSFDIAGFFKKVEFRMSGGGEEVLRGPMAACNVFTAPPWAATEARRIEFWMEVAEAGEDGNAAARLGTRRGWWSGDHLGGCLEEVCWRLRNGGWKEEEVREMMMMDGGDAADGENNGYYEPRGGWRVGSLSKRLLSAGWSTEDVVESLGYEFL